MNEMLVLMHKARMCMRVPLDGADATAKNAPAWSTKLRKYRGTADLLKQQRNIDGRIAQGFKLDMQGSAIISWADAANGQPMKMTGDGTVQQHYHFTFDQPLDEQKLSLKPPAGFSRPHRMQTNVE